MPKATSQKRLNRDHARQQQRPMVEEEVIAAQLEALVTPAIAAFRKLLSLARSERSNIKFTKARRTKNSSPNH